MQSRRDQVQAYRFVTRRIVSAMLSGEPETTDQPMRRLSLSLFASAMVAVIVLAAAGVYGLLTGASAPLEPNTLVIERETHARYVYVDDHLHPVLNYASARLILGVDEPSERAMPRAALRDYPRGPLVGIVDAPDSLPEPDDLVGLPWRVCSRPPDADRPEPLITAVIGREVAGGSPLGDRALFVADGREQYLLWNDQRLRIGGQTPRVVLGLATAQPVSGATQLINTIAAGPDLAGVQVPGAGAPSGFRIDGQETRVGRVFRAGPQYFLMTREGLVPVGDVTAQIRIAGGIESRDINTQAANQAMHPQPVRLEPEGFPATVPQMYPVAGAPPTVCAVYRGGTEGVLATTIEIFDTTPDELGPSASQPVEVAQSEQDVVATAHRVLVEAGRGSLVRAVPAAGVTSETGTLYLITADGIRYPLAAAAAAALGYGEVEPVPVPAALVEMVPLGPTLDSATARRPVRAGGSAG